MNKEWVLGLKASKQTLEILLKTVNHLVCVSFKYTLLCVSTLLKANIIFLSTCIGPHLRDNALKCQPCLIRRSPGKDIYRSVSKGMGLLAIQVVTFSGLSPFLSPLLSIIHLTRTMAGLPENNSADGRGVSRWSQVMGFFISSPSLTVSSRFNYL